MDVSWFFINIVIYHSAVIINVLMVAISVVSICIIYYIKIVHLSKSFIYIYIK